MLPAPKSLGCRPQDILHMEIRKKSIDARKKPALYSVYTVWADCGDREEKILKPSEKPSEHFPGECGDLRLFPGSLPERFQPKTDAFSGYCRYSPAGLFCGYLLALWGLCPILLERGRPRSSVSGT